MACALWCLSSLAVVVAIAVVDLVGAAASFKSKVWLNKLIPPSQASPPPPSHPNPSSAWAAPTTVVDPVEFATAPGPSCLDLDPLWADLELVTVLGRGPSSTEFVGTLVTTTYLCLNIIQAALKVHHGGTTPGADLTNSPPLGLRLWASPCTAGDELPPYSSVAQCGFQQRLCRPCWHRFFEKRVRKDKERVADERTI
jgi:hypothetical protein